MTIKRNINGQDVEIELTDAEKNSIVWEYEHNCDLDDTAWEEGYECYGVTEAEYEKLHDRIACRYRKYRGNDDQWTYDREAAIEYIVAAYKSGEIKLEV